MRVIVDNSRGADATFAAGLERALRSAGFEVELRPPAPSALFDTSVHFVVEGVAIRVPTQLRRPELETIAAAVRDAESHRSERQRYRAVPVYLGETSRVVKWVDVFGEGF